MTASTATLHVVRRCAFIAIIVVVNAAPVNSANTFQIAIARLQENAMGIMVYSLIQILLWPSSSRASLEAASQQLTSTQQQLCQALGDCILGRGKPEAVQSLGGKEMQLLGQCSGALANAELDSFEVKELSHRWHRYCQVSNDLMKGFARVHEAMPEIQQIDLSKRTIHLESFISELGRRLSMTAEMLKGKAPDGMPEPIQLELKVAEGDEVSHLQRATLGLVKTRLEALDALTRDLFLAVQSLKDFAPAVEPKAAKPKLMRRWSLTPPDPDRLKNAGAIVATVWIAHLIYIYLHPATQTNLVHLAVLFVLACIMMGINPKILTTLLLQGGILSGICYLFIMPHLSGFLEVGTMLFIVVAVMFYLTMPARKRLARSVVLSLFFVLIYLNNEQSYSFTTWANTLLSAYLALLIAVVVMNGLGLFDYEKDFIKQLSRFFRQADFLLDQVGTDRTKPETFFERWQMAACRRDLAGIPKKLNKLKSKLNYDLLPGTKPDQVTKLATNLEILAHWLVEVDQARDLPHNDILKEALGEDVLTWRSNVQKQYRLWAEPSIQEDTSENIRERFVAGMEKLEKRLAEVMRSDDDQGGFKEAEYESLYRFLGAFRGLSNSGIAYGSAAAAIQWDPWQEARF